MMTYIPPTGTIQMLAGVHLNPKQEDTLWYDTTYSRDAAFDDFVFRTYTEQSYSRPTRNSVKIQDTADRLYGCSYMRFKNGAAFGGQWIYCFVLAVEYVNNNTCEVFYEIDDMITWFPQCELRQCFVEREIPATDKLFENVIPETFALGDYCFYDDYKKDLGDPRYLVLSKTNEEGTRMISADYGLLGSVYYRDFDALIPWNDSDKEAVLLNSDFYKYIEKFDDRPDDIISVRCVPSWLVQHTPYIPYQEIYSARVEDFEYVYDLNPPDYVVKNKKLFTAPFTYISASNNCGQLNSYNPELFETTYSEGMAKIKFQLAGTYLGSPSIYLIPKNYRSIALCYDEALPLSTFPIIPWATDSFQAYIAQNRASALTSLLSNVISAGFSGLTGYAYGQITQATGNALQFQKPDSVMGRSMSAQGTAQMNLSVMGAGISASDSVLSALGKTIDAQMLPKGLTSSVQGDMLQTLMGRCAFDIYKVQRETEIMKVIDEYFSCYGYAIHRIKIPNTHSRPFWNYTKTQGCIVVGDVPSDALARISAIFDRGIRFWKHNAYIGDYSLNNSV